MGTSRVIAASLLLLIGVAACSDDSDVSTGGDGGGDATTTTRPATIGTPGGGPAGLFVEVRVGGGFAPAGFDFRNPPAAVVYEDGTVMVPGAITLQFPGPAVLPVFTGHIDDADMQDLLDAAAAAGLVGGSPDVGDASSLPIADAATTTVTVYVDGDEQTVDAYALAEATGAQSGLSEAQLAARAALADFVADVEQLAGSEATEPLVPERYRVLAMAPIDPATLDASTPTPGEQDWPAGLPALTEGECTAVTDDGVAALTDALSSANELTQWRQGDDTFSLVVRIVLPHEPDCPTEG